MMPRRSLRLALIAAVVFAPHVALAAESSTERCLASAEAGQRDRDAGNYASARASFTACAATSCPPLVTRDCTRWLDELDRAQPSVVVTVRDEQGRDIPGARLTIDGVPLSVAPGRPAALDPGEHQVAAEVAGFARAREPIIVVTGEKNRVLVMTLRREAGAPAEPAQAQVAPASSSPWPLAIALVGVGAVSLGGSIFFGVSARSDLEDARSSPCGATRSCDPSEGRSIETRLVVADVLLGVSVVALAGAALWVLLHRPASAATARKAVVLGSF